MAGLSLTSPAFADGGPIPRRFGYKHGNASPPLAVSGVPPGCRSLALVMDDPDAVAAVGRVWVHWLLWNLPPETREVPESSVPAGCREGTTDFGEAGYGGPAPPDRRHTYVFRLMALDVAPELPAGAGRADLEGAVRGHVLAEAVLTGTYEPVRPRPRKE